MFSSALRVNVVYRQTASEEIGRIQILKLLKQHQVSLPAIRLDCKSSLMKYFSLFHTALMFNRWYNSWNWLKLVTTSFKMQLYNYKFSFLSKLKATSC